MRWSWKIAQVGDIGVYVHATFAILLLWMAISFWSMQPSITFVLSGLAFVFSLFACVTIHEFGHALTAKHFGVRTRDITLLPIGGIARTERIPRDPKQEFAIAIAGPVTTLLIAVALFLWLRITDTWQPLARLSFTEGPFIERLMIVNLTLAAFNMLPAFPTDGGRVLRALLASRMVHARATAIAARLGQAMALMFGALSLLGNPFFVLIALFVWFGATQESQLVQMGAALEGIPVRHLMRTQFRSLSPGDSLAEASQMLLRGIQADFPVVDDGRVVGMLTRGHLLAALSRFGENTPVAKAMSRDVPTLEAAEMLDEAFDRLQQAAVSAAPVMDQGQLVGLLAVQSLADFVRVRTAPAALTSAAAVKPPRFPLS